MNDRYLRNRPFLVVEQILRPREGVKTEVAGWTKLEGNWTGFHRPVIVDRVNDNHLINAHIIIDLINNKIIKTRDEETPEVEQLMYYVGQFQGYIDESIMIWQAQNPQYFAPQAQQEVEETLTVNME